MTSTKPFVGTLIGAGWEDCRTLGEDRAFVVRIRLDGPIAWPMQAVWQGWPVTVSRAEALSPTPDGVIEEGRRPDEPGRRGGIYTASKTRHADRWKALRAAGWPIISTWIDEAGVGDTACFTDLWRRCVSEAASADAVLLYREPGDTLKGALVEAGAALASGVPVYAIGCEKFSFAKHALWTDCSSLEEARFRMEVGPVRAAEAPKPHPHDPIGERGAIPEGWVLLPRSPTPEMICAGGYACQPYCDLTMDAAADVYRAMIEAAPTPSAPREGDHA